MKKLLLLGLVFVLGILSAPAQNKTVNAGAVAKNTVSNSLEKTLVAKEKQKWNALRNGQWLALKDMFADEYLSIGYQPDGTVKITAKAEIFSQENRLPAGVEFALSDFKIISADKTNVVLTYRVAGPIKLHATSVWTKRGKEWKTILYQATMTR